jgi:predicted unusual protein kinase regulating ubiquinone biosynthesis (AarF/ABC1/UbiB family)
MTRLVGQPLTAYLEHASPDERDRILGAFVDELASQILVRGTVHADPHPGNFLVVPAGPDAPAQLAILDFGCTLSLGKPERAAYARLVLAIAGGNREAAATELAALGFVVDDPQKLVELTASLIAAMRPDTAVSDLDWESAFATQIAQAKQLGGLAIPRSFVLLGRVLATVAGLLAKYRPRIHVHPLIAKHLMTAIR